MLRVCTIGKGLHAAYRAQSAFVESFIGRLRDELLEEGIFQNLAHNSAHGGLRPHTAWLLRGRPARTR